MVLNRVVAIAYLAIFLAPSLLAFAYHDDAEAQAITQTYDVCFTTGGGTVNGGDCAGRVVEEIDSAETSIDIFAYELTESRIAEALIRAQRRNVAVRVIANANTIATRASLLPALIQNDVPVYLDGVPGLEHNKSAIIDTKIVLTGSLNWTKAANERNAENLLIVHDTWLAAEYEANFLQRLADSEPWR